MDSKDQFERNRAWLRQSRLFSIFESSLLLGEGLAVSWAASSAMGGWAGAAFLSAWFWWRVKDVSMIECSFAPSLGRRSALVLVCLLGVACGMWIHGELLSASNVSLSGAVSWSRVAQYALLSPLSEELLFRAVFLVSLLRRGAFSPMWCAALSAAAFSASHLSNSSVPLAYRAVQAAYCLLTGMCYARTLVRERHFTDIVALHCGNNVLALFVPVDTVAQNLSAPFVFLPLTAVCLVHASLLV